MFFDFNTINKNALIFKWLYSIQGLNRTKAFEICYIFNFNLKTRIKDITYDDFFLIRNLLEYKYDIGSMILRDIFKNIKHLKDIKTIRGVRHSERLPVRGQRTRTNAKTQKKRKKNRY